ncbi:hypothetical protein MINTM020_42160 [Mycobacterium paraintracellulare]|uniref:superoxide dismutase family protein n=1 Tax=Mycobacterium paraintracellulare TaxID=1138383 RepID=UPI001926E24D|nr:superoxide dismutase family protein [Mycobacterium paraintracellulare]BCP12118.1 hypothetical protein MINTM020_42160 [Mycobacterium paraintracellulare]
MNKGASFAVAALTATLAPLAACANQQGSQPNTSPLTSPAPGAERLTTQLKTADGIPVANATFEFANGYATVTVEAGPNQVLSPGFHGLQIHSVGKCEGDFDSAGSVYQAADHTGYPASGDLTALQVRSDGSAKLVTTSNSFTAADLRSSSGSALILHQSVDNLGGGPTAESNKRIACGVIAAASATTTSSTTSVTTSTSTSTVVVPPPSTSTSTSTSTVTVTSTPTTTSAPTTTVTTPPSLPPGTR